MLTITDAAANHIKSLIKASEKPVEGLRIGVASKGCSGMSYVIEYAEKKSTLEEVVEVKGVKLFIDPFAVMYLIGSEVDYVESKLKSGFVFSNPNEKSRCGCGESFSI